MKTTLLLLALSSTTLAAPREPKFHAVTIDDKIQIGYGVAVADVDGDKWPDILLADKKQFVWYRNPGAEKSGEPAAWAKFLLAENLTKNDNVCLAAQDIDGDGKCEIAVGAEWNPGDTVNSGAVFYLIAPAERTQPWTPVKLHAEPTTHRMRWMQMEGAAPSAPPAGKVASAEGAAPSRWGLVVVPLHGRGNKNGEGAGVKVLLYHPPTPLNDPKSEWKTELIDESMHVTHNFHLKALGKWPGLLLGGKEGVKSIHFRDGQWKSVRRVGKGSTEFAGVELAAKGVGEIREGELGADGSIDAFIEPMHGGSLTAVISIVGPSPSFGLTVHTRVLTETLSEGHALACGDLLGADSDQIVVGWRGTPGKEGSTHGIHLWTALDPQGEKWRDSAVDDGGMACEDLQLADLNGDGKLDIVASGRATHNVKVYFNQTVR